ncbi:hypothetical protein BFL34_01422 [Clavibacter michiganensis]|uniref:LysM domain-containing protein n=2 Tax=Clavibacter michiganensis TaxID=28447 RepID=A0A251Y8K0_9MICO|nr:hypothetical protein BFL34_01422 [Clavibacter michiganensis]
MRAAHAAASLASMTRRPLLAAALLATAALLAGCTSAVDGGPDPTPAVIEGERTPATSPAAPDPVVPTDGGPRSQAQGEVSSVVGTLTYYTPASGDTLTGVAARFGLCIADLEGANGNSDITAGEEIVVARTTATPLDDRACLG